MKNIITLAVSLFSLTIFAQVGINNNTPKATLDITAQTTNGSKPEGLLPPRLTGDQIQAGDAQYTAAQEGIVIYATAAATAPSTKTANITAAGYYFYDGSAWQKLTGAAAGDTTNDAWVNDTSNTMVKVGTNADGTARTAGTEVVVKDNGNVGIGTNNPAAALDINSTTGSFVPPRMSTVQRDALISPPKGSLIYDTTTDELELNVGSSVTPKWQIIHNSQIFSTQVEHTSLNIAPAVNLNTFTNGGSWVEVSALKKTITVSIGSNIAIIVNAILGELGTAGLVAQADLMLKVTPDAIGLASTLPTASNPRDAVAFIIGNGNGQNTSISIARNITAVSNTYTIQVYASRQNSPTNHSFFSLSPIYTNILATQ